MPLMFAVEKFEGPLDLLLQLVEGQQLDISTISLAKVADQFVSYVEEQKNIPLEELADFLLVAAKLIYLKSRLLLPALAEPALEEGPDLETQLRRYRAFVDASKRIQELWKEDRRSFSRERHTPVLTVSIFLPPSNVTPTVLREVIQRVIRRIEPMCHLPQASMARVVSIQEMIQGLLHRVRTSVRITLKEFMGRQATKVDQIVGFLALLELVKQRFVRVDQSVVFEDISIELQPEASTVGPQADSFL